MIYYLIFTRRQTFSPRDDQWPTWFQVRVLLCLCIETRLLVHSHRSFSLALVAVLPVSLPLVDGRRRGDDGRWLCSAIL
jgi:hypothetical protein